VSLSRRPDAARTHVSLSPATWAALIAAFLIVTALLTLTAVTLISQRQRTVLLNQQLGALVGETSVALHGVTPLLRAVPPRSATIKSRADSVARLVSRATPLVGQLAASGLPSTLTATGQLVSSLEQHGRLTNTLDNVSVLAASANQAALVTRLGGLLDAVPSASALIAQLTNLAGQVQEYRLIPSAARGLKNIGVLVHLQAHALRVSEATLENGRSARAIAKQTLRTAQTTLAAAQQILTIAEQTLAHAASLDRKVGPVP
jgi:hypothetical protein